MVWTERGREPDEKQEEEETEIGGWGGGAKERQARGPVNTTLFRILSTFKPTLKSAKQRMVSLSGELEHVRPDGG